MSFIRDIFDLRRQIHISNASGRFMPQTRSEY